MVIGNFSYSRKTSKVGCFKQFHGRKKWNYGIGVKMASTLFLYRICLICISLDWKFSPEFIFVHLGVIRGHLTGSKKVIWGQKSKIRPNSNDMHIIRLEIFSRVHFLHLEVIRGHLMGSKKVIWGQKSVIWLNTHDMHTIRFEIFF